MSKQRQSFLKVSNLSVFSGDIDNTVPGNVLTCSDVNGNVKWGKGAAIDTTGGVNEGDILVWDASQNSFVSVGVAASGVNEIGVVITDISSNLLKSNASINNTAESGIAIGPITTCTGAGGITIGTNSITSADAAMALGVSSIAAAPGSISLGSSAKCESIANGSVAIGQNTTVQKANSLAVGNFSYTDAAGCVSVGNGAGSTGDNATAVGMGALATGTNSVSIGAGSTASHNLATALGYNAATTADSSFVARTRIEMGVNDETDYLCIMRLSPGFGLSEIIRSNILIRNLLPMSFGFFVQPYDLEEKIYSTSAAHFRGTYFPYNDLCVGTFNIPDVSINNAPGAYRNIYGSIPQSVGGSGALALYNVAGSGSAVNRTLSELSFTGVCGVILQSENAGISSPMRFITSQNTDSDIFVNIVGNFTALGRIIP